MCLTEQRDVSNTEGREVMSGTVTVSSACCCVCVCVNTELYLLVCLPARQRGFLIKFNPAPATLELLNFTRNRASFTFLTTFQPRCCFVQPQPLDFEATNSYVFNVDVTEDHGHLRGYADNKNSAVTSARVQTAHNTHTHSGRPELREGEVLNYAFGKQGRLTFEVWR